MYPLPPLCVCYIPSGYSLNALVDFPADDPIEVIKHLIIGSEGTLGFVSQATYNTVPGETEGGGGGDELSAGGLLVEAMKHDLDQIL